ncbi:MAG: tRNA dihydrouridine(20/20a) synthase DusA [Leptospiraceae bacterium]|nr:tRNA dihydrouridine(20/20a) synthase DusA [Leptospiraceae bacterium]
MKNFSHNVPILSIAPMMEWTDRHFRYFMRFITKHTLLYTEMITAKAILNGDINKLLSFSKEELPVSLQLGGDNPKELAKSAKIGEDFGYSEINLNVGCPSEKVKEGRFGACLMAYPKLVAECISEIKSNVKLPVTVKHRIGINGLESYENLAHFVSIVSTSACDRFVVHARIAILEGLSPEENRNIPPLRYEDVYKLKQDFPHLTIEINGGIRTLEDVQKHLRYVDGVMIGRAAYENPYLFAQADEIFFHDQKNPLTREEVLEAMLPYLEEHQKQGGKLHHVMRHVLGLYYSQPYGKKFRRFVTENMYKNPPAKEFIHKLKQEMKALQLC